MVKKNRKKTTAVPLGNVLPGVLRSVRYGGDTQLLQVWDLWDNAVGETIARNARPSAFKGRLLLVEVANSAWVHELQFMKSEIIERLNNAFGTVLVEEIKFRVGSFS